MMELTGDELVCHTGQTGTVYGAFQDSDTKIGVYEWEGLLGRGSFGIVLRVFNKNRQEHTALKVQLYRHTKHEKTGTNHRTITCTDHDGNTVIDNEIIIASKLSCDHIEGFIKLYDYFMCKGYPSYKAFENSLSQKFHYNPSLSYIEMQLAEDNLHKLLVNPDAMTLVDKLYFFFEIIFSLNTALKTMGFVHGDIAPRNILFVTNQKPRLYEIHKTRLEVNGHFRPLIADFGMSSAREAARGDYSDLSALNVIAKEWGFTLLRNYEEPIGTIQGMDLYNELWLVSIHGNYDLFLALLYDRIIELKNNTMMDRLTGLCAVCLKETSMVHRESKQFFCNNDCLYTQV